MTVTVQPAGSLKGTVTLPASKSYSIRCALVAACGGRSEIRNFSDCDDARVALRVAAQLGAKVKRLSRNHYLIESSGLRLRRSFIQVGESGTVLRFVLPLLAFKDVEVKVDGRGTLRGRPNHYLVKVLKRLGADIGGQGPGDSIPLTISGRQPKGSKIRIDGSLSSQFISALLIACPLTGKPMEITVTGQTMVSQPYITMTRLVLEKTGIFVNSASVRRFAVPGEQAFHGLGKMAIPSDSGLAAFLMAAGILTDSRISLKGNLDDRLIQADGEIYSFLEKMGAELSIDHSRIKMKKCPALKGGKFCLKNSPDLVPVMAVLALFCRGRTRLTNIGHVRAKESDRITDLRRELLKIGAQIDETKQELLITPRSTYRTNVTLDPHRDHRLAMAFFILGLKLGARIKDIDCTKKSYPGFLKDMRHLGARYKTV